MSGTLWDEMSRRQTYLRVFFMICGALGSAGCNGRQVVIDDADGDADSTASSPTNTADYAGAGSDPDPGSCSKSVKHRGG